MGKVDVGLPRSPAPGCALATHEGGPPHPQTPLTRPLHAHHALQAPLRAANVAMAIHHALSIDRDILAGLEHSAIPDCPPCPLLSL